MRIGHGYDVHKYKDGRPCVICGVRIPSPFGPDGHSDADVATHALMDALLGAAALGDIGRLFPDSDDVYLNANSMDLLDEVMVRIRQKGFQVGNADITIVAQRPKLMPYIEEMRSNIAYALKTSIENINIKATTEEGMGFTGACLGIAAHAVVLLER